MSLLHERPTNLEQFALHQGCAWRALWRIPLIKVAALFLAVIWLLALAGCGHFGTAMARNVAGAQLPGSSTGGGATFTGPANSAAPSTQHAKRRVAWFPPAAATQPAAPSPSAASAQPTAVSTPVVVPEPAIAPSPGYTAAAPAWIDEDVTTTFGQHQDAAGIVKAASTLAGWSRVRWFGLAIAFFAYSGLLWSHNNQESGYPLVFWKFGAVGVALVIIDPSPWWCVLLVIPASLYLAQKFNLLRLPGLP